MIFDTHVHTELSTDSEMPIRHVAEAIDEKDIGVIITEHYDYDYPGEGFRCDPKEFLERYGKYRSENILLGIEVGITHSSIVQNQQMIESFPFDYVIGSIHMVDGLDIFLDYSKLEVGEKEFYDKYYEYMLRCIKGCHCFDSLGHIDYIYRYAPFSPKEIHIDWHREVIEAIFKAVITKEKAIELNTRRMNDKQSKKILFELYKLYSVLGGRYVTLGSDAHTKDAIGLHFKEALELSEAAGLKPIYFKERQMQYCK